MSAAPTSSPIRIFAGTVPFSSTAFYTAPIGFTVVVTSIVVANIGSFVENYWLTKDGQAAIIPHVQIKPNEVLALDTSFSLAAGKKLRHAASASNAFTVYISGIVTA